MKISLTSLLLLGMFCFVPLTMTGCGGGGEPVVVDSGGLEGDPTMTDDMEDEYEKEMARQYSEGQGGGDE